MRRSIFLCTLLGLSATAAACPPKPPSPEPDVVVVDAATADAGGGEASASVAACANLAALGCPEGADASVCVRTIDHVQAGHLTDLHPDCLARARTKAEARACGAKRDGGGSVDCP